jgi:NTE family protein
MDQIGTIRGFARPLSSLPLFNVLSDAALSALEGELAWLCLPGGRTLFHEGDCADALYVVQAGCLAVSACRNGRVVRVARSGAGELVGEMALLGDGVRSATVTALRDSELLRLGRPSFERLIERHPKSMLSMVSLLARRLRDTTHRVGEPAAIRTIALAPSSPRGEHAAIASGLADILAANGQRVALLDRASATWAADWFTKVETSSDLVLDCADHEDSAWTRLCLRQADRVVLVMPANAQSALPGWTAAEATFKVGLLIL